MWPAVSLPCEASTHTEAEVGRGDPAEGVEALDDDSMMEGGVEDGDAMACIATEHFDPPPGAPPGAPPAEPPADVCFCKTDRHLCTNEYGFNGTWIGCDECPRWCHSECVGLTADEAEACARFVCPECEACLQVVVRVEAVN